MCRFELKKPKRLLFILSSGYILSLERGQYEQSREGEMFSQYSDILVCQCLALQLMYIKQKASVQRSDQIFKG